MNKRLKFILLIIISISILTPLIFLLLSNIGTIESEDGRTIVSYCGSIIGGAFTLIGVLWTIKYEEKMRISENKPILFINPDITFDVDDKNKLLNFKFKISNSGKGIAYSINIEPIEKNIIRDKNSFIDYLPSGKEIESCFLFQYKEELDLLNFSTFSHEFKISYDSFYKCDDSLHIYINPFSNELFNKHKKLFEKYSF